MLKQWNAWRKFNESIQTKVFFFLLCWVQRKQINKEMNTNKHTKSKLLHLHTGPQCIVGCPSSTRSPAWVTDLKFLFIIIKVLPEHLTLQTDFLTLINSWNCFTPAFPGSEHPTSEFLSGKVTQKHSHRGLMVTVFVSHDHGGAGRSPSACSWCSKCSSCLQPNIKVPLRWKSCFWSS